ncbi:hypothetical protein AcV5_000129 [Taiwanofungus camphoratus]|nr:hypothetical protein AcV5_000129 [Antrodia cinnamomea]
MQRFVSSRSPPELLVHTIVPSVKDSMFTNIGNNCGTQQSSQSVWPLVVDYQNTEQEGDTCGRCRGSIQKSFELDGVCISTQLHSLEEIPSRSRNPCPACKTARYQRAMVITKVVNDHVAQLSGDRP